MRQDNPFGTLHEAGQTFWQIVSADIGGVCQGWDGWQADGLPCVYHADHIRGGLKSKVPWEEGGLQDGAERAYLNVVEDNSSV